MTSILAVNNNNDIFAENGQLQVQRNIKATLQACEHAIKAIRNEMTFAADRGIDYFTTVWNGSPNVLAFEASARTQILRIDSVENILQFVANFNPTNSTINYFASIQTNFGIGNING